MKPMNKQDITDVVVNYCGVQPQSLSVQHKLEVPLPQGTQLPKKWVKT